MHLMKEVFLFCYNSFLYIRGILMNILILIECNPHVACATLYLEQTFFRSTSISKPISKLDMIETYVNKHDDLYEKAQESNDCLTNCVLFDACPLGNVVLFYDKNDEAFHYYSDCLVSYSILNSACKKFVYVFSCKQLFQCDSDDENDDENDEPVETKQNECKTDSQAKYKNVYVQLKKKKKDPRRIIVEKKTNKFLYKGKLANYAFLQKPPPLENENLSFADFKRLS